MPVSIRHAWLAALTTLLADRAGAADTPRPIYAFNQHPIAQVHGLPSLGDARPLALHRTEVEVALAIANHFAGEANDSEFLSLDGETYRTTLIARHGFAPGFEAGLEFPYVSHSGGFLDGMIDNFHQTFGLSQGGRETAPQDRVEYRYRRDGVERLSFTEPAQGIGDLRLTAALSLDNDSGIPLSLRGLVKLPTGDADELTGSGATDFALWLSAACRKTSETPCMYGGVGAVWLGNGEVIEGQARNVVPWASVGLRFQAFPALDLKIQIDSHGSLYRDSTIRTLEEHAVQFLAATEWQAGPRTVLEVGFSEDLSVETSSDIVLQIAFRQLF